MLFHKSTKSISDLNLKINNNLIAKVTTFNFLGLHLTSNLSCATHILITINDEELPNLK